MDDSKAGGGPSNRVTRHVKKAKKVDLSKLPTFEAPEPRASELHDELLYGE